MDQTRLIILLQIEYLFRSSWLFLLTLNIVEHWVPYSQSHCCYFEGTQLFKLIEFSNPFIIMVNKNIQSEFQLLIFNVLHIPNELIICSQWMYISLSMVHNVLGCSNWIIQITVHFNIHPSTFSKLKVIGFWWSCLAYTFTWSS